MRFRVGQPYLQHPSATLAAIQRPAAFLFRQLFPVAFHGHGPAATLQVEAVQSQTGATMFALANGMSP